MAEITRHQAGRVTAGLGGGCAVLFGSVFIFGGLAFAFFLYLPAMAGWWKSRSWVEVPCRIESTKLREAQSDDGTSYEAQAAYSYAYQGRTYRSERVSLTDGSDNFGDYQRRRHAELRMAQEQQRPFRCLVNPDHPEEAVLFADLRWTLMLLMSLFPTLFPLAGGLVAFGGLAMARDASKMIVLQQRFPDEPWKWRLEWADGIVRASPDGLAGILAVALWILVVQVPLAAAVVMSGAVQESPLALLAFVPLAIAFFPLRAVWRRLRRRRMTGAVSLETGAWPLRPGAVLEGQLRFSQVLSPRLPLAVRVRAVRKVTRGSGDSTSTSEETLWEHTDTLSAAEARREDQGCALPIHVELSAGTPGADIGSPAAASGGPGEILWMLEVLAGDNAMPIKLPLPVFGGGAVEPAHGTPPRLPPVVEEDITEQLVARLQARGIQAAFSPDGTPESLTCPAGRNRGIAIFLLIFGSIWFGAMLMIFAQDAPLIFKLVWGLTAPAILLLALYLLMNSRQALLTPGGLTLTSRIGPFYTKTETLEPRHIVQFMHDHYMRSGNAHFYRVRVETTFGRKITLVDSLGEEATARKLEKRLMAWRRAVE